MSLTLDHLLTLAGRLDDAPGYDAPRERLRRFLLSYVTDAPIVRGLIEQGQHAPDDQHHRALQDLVVLLGRWLGFKTAFGLTAASGGRPADHGRWISRAPLTVVVNVPSHQAPVPEIDDLVRAVEAVRATAGADARVAGLCILGPLHMNRRAVDAAAAAAAPGFPLGVVGLHSLLSLADLVNAGKVSHDDVVRLIETNVSIDFIVDVRGRAEGAAAEPTQAVATAPDLGAQEAGYWVATVARNQGMRPEEFLELVVGRRHLFGVAGGLDGAAARQGDWLCFHIAGLGIVGHARVAALGEGGSGIRDAHRFRQLLQLDDLTLYTQTPVTPDSETALRLRLALAAGPRQTDTLLRISRESFDGITAGAAAARRPAAADETLLG